MTVSKVSIKPRRVTLTADGVLTDFDFDFKIFDENEVTVYDRDTSDVATLQTIGVDYTVTFDSEAETGTISFLVAPTNLHEILMISNVDYEQSTDIPKGGGFSEPVVEKAYDLLAIQIQQLRDGLDRAVTLSDTSPLSSVTLPDPEADAPIGWNSTADDLTNNPPGVYRVRVDVDATEDYLGATSGDGVLRTSSPMTYADGGDFITLGVDQTAIDHDALLNFVANEHIDHTSVSITGGGILTGGGDISASRVITLNHSDVDHDQTTNFLGDEHVAHSGVVLTAGAGLTGGGDISASRSFAIDIPGQAAATVASGDLLLVADVDDSNNLKQVTAGAIAALGGGGAIEVEDEGISLTTAVTKFNFIGAGVTVTEPIADEVDVTIPGTSTPVEVEDEGISLTTSVTKINFVGAGVTVTEPVADEVEVSIPGGGGGASLTEDVNQTSHGFSVGQWLYHNGTQYALADASAATTAESIGVVSAVAGVDDFTIQFGGKVTGLSGLTAGEAHFLSETAGQLTATAPTTTGAIVKPILVADSTTTGFIFNMRGNEITLPPAGSSFRLSFTDGDLSSGVLTVNHNLGEQYIKATVYDNNNLEVIPDEVDVSAGANSCDVDLTTFGTLTGTWNVFIKS